MPKYLCGKSCLAFTKRRKLAEKPLFALNFGEIKETICRLREQ
jgi:hypothetical protein